MSNRLSRAAKKTHRREVEQKGKSPEQKFWQYKCRQAYMKLIQGEGNKPEVEAE